MYKTVYWHKTVRIATAMVKKALFLGIQKGVIHPEQLYNLNDHTLFSLAESHQFEPFKLLRFVAARKLHKQVFSEPFDSSKKSHLALENLDFRISTENKIADELSKKTGCLIKAEDIIIDIPERISFEIDVPVQANKSRGNILFQESGSVFTPATISNFVKTLRHLSLFVIRKDSVLDALKKIDIKAIIEG